MWLGYVFLSNLIASAVTLLMLWPQIRGFSFRVDKKLLNSMFSYSLPIFIANVSFIVNEHLDKILLPSLLPGNVGERELGIYGAISKIAMFLSIFVQAFRLGAEPFFFSYAKNENAKKSICRDNGVFRYRNGSCNGGALYEHRMAEVLY